MKKVSVAITNDYCMQSLFLYGTRNEDGTDDFGLFCWFSYCWDEDLGVICAIGGDKRTKANILREGRFSANLVTEELLRFADYCGLVEGNSGEKRFEGVQIDSGAVLDVPTIAESPVTFELEVKKSFEQADGCITFICKIVNVLMREDLAASSASAGSRIDGPDVGPAVPPEERMKAVHPVLTTVGRYFSLDGRFLGKWHDLPEEIKTYAGR